MEEIVKLLRLLEDHGSGVKGSDIIGLYKIPEKTLVLANRKGLIQFYNMYYNSYCNYFHMSFLCQITQSGSDYLITGGAEGLMKRDEENKKISEETLLVSKKTLLVSSIAVIVSILALFTTIVIYFLTK
ncbi:hypothetical protein [Dysgonomonas sp. BGC7]|uniref:hypothetical protein n=1 Tax=Dysgonomonas sp. BGC7 TaxID=1658008 RepID=UPI0006802107|nr:hypothetical protein [Dysgonomonas sp. BGC7]MBD8389675.1 hypothetical protein [Dysgonomonas sp. BGC7]